MSDTSHCATDDRPTEEIAGDAMCALLTFALREVKARVGESNAIEVLDQVESGLARIDCAVSIGGNNTRIRCTVVPAEAGRHPFIVADIDLLRIATAH